MWTIQQVAETIDHAILKPDLTTEDVIAGCALGKKYGVASVCVRPTDVTIASQELAGSSVKLSTVVGFPHGSNRTETKALEAELAIMDGAVEVDMVINIGKFLSGDDEFTRSDIEAVVTKAKRHNVLVKVILETCYLSDEQINRACKIARDAGADYVKTSTGFGAGSATPQAVKIMVESVGNTMGVKASGGIKSYQTAVNYLELGCKRLGVGSTESVLNDSTTVQNRDHAPY